MVNFKRFGSLLPLLLGISKVLGADEVVEQEGSTGNSNTPKPIEYNFNDGQLYIKDGVTESPYKNPLPGYYKYKDIEGTDNYVKCDRYEKCEDITSSLLTKSICKVNGELIINSRSENKVGICLENKAYTFVEFGENDKNYVVSQNVELFGFDAKTTHVLLKISTNSITFDNTAKDFEDQCVLKGDNNGYIVDRKVDFCSTDSTDMYYTCKSGKCTTKKQDDYEDVETEYTKEKCTFIIDEGTVNNSCTKKGYYLHVDGQSKKLIECLVTQAAPLTGRSGEISCGIKTTTGITGYYWNELQYNEIIKCVDGDCSLVTFEDECQKAGDFIDNGYNVKLCNTASTAFVFKGIEDKLIEDKKENNYIDNIFGEENIRYVVDTNDYKVEIKKEHDIKDTILENKHYICSNGKCKKTDISINSSLDCKYTNAKLITEQKYFITADGQFIQDTDSDKDKYSGYLISIKETKCNVISKSNGYYVFSESQLVFCNTEQGCKLDNSVLLVAKPTDYPIYLLNSDNTDSTKLIRCTSSSECKVYKGEKGYYLDGSVDSKELSLIYCNGSTCSATMVASRRAYYTKDINGEVTTEGIILCNNGCVKATLGTEEKYYLNGGVGSNVTPLIHFKSGADPEIEVIDSSKKELYKNANDVKGFIYCSSPTECSEISKFQDKEYVDVKEKKIHYYDDEKEKWSESDINLETNGDSNAYYVNKLTNEILTNNNEDGKLVVCSKASDVTTCGIVTKEFKTYYINGGDDSKSLIQYDKSKTKFSLMKNVDEGYYINSNTDVISCNENCENFSIPENCDVNEGKIIKSSNTNKFCISTSKSVELTTKEEKYMVGSDSDSKIYKVNNKNVLVDKSEGYYLIKRDDTKKFVSAKDIAGDVYYCNGVKCVKQTISDEKYLPNDDENTNSNLTKIYCNGGQCKLNAKSATENYCIKTNDGNTDKSLYVCKDACDFTAQNNCSNENNKIGYYLGYYNSYLIKCSDNGNCEKEILDDSAIGYYLNMDNSKPLIQCYTSLGKTNCAAVSEVKNGYYTTPESTTDGNIIKCNNGKCKLETVTVTAQEIKYFVSGETNKHITKCEEVVEQEPEPLRRSGVEMVTKCTAIASPKLGWYVNGDKNAKTEGLDLILCSKTNGSFSCIEKPKNIGYYLSSEDNKLLNCDKTGCNDVVDLSESSANSYYVNGENNQLIYCQGPNCKSIDVNSKGFYLSATNQKYLIKCDKVDKNIVCTELTKPGTNGVYMNADTYTLSQQPLIVYNDDDYDDSKSKFKLSGNDIKNGWYKSAETDVLTKSPDNSVIKCTNSRNCSYVKVKDSQCSPSIAGEFSKVNGKLQWCKTDGSGFVDFVNGEVISEFNKNDKIPGVNLPSGVKKAYALLQVDTTFIVRSDAVDGYKYDKSLYFCPKEKYGICTEVSTADLVPGIYIDHKITNKEIKCSEVDKKVICEETENKFVTYSDGYKINNKDMYGINVDYMYAFANNGNSFPTTGDYFRANVNKYSIKLIKNIEGVEDITKYNNKFDSNGKLFVNKIKDSEGKLKENDENIDANYYDYDTNYGFYEYSKVNEAISLDKVVIYFNETEEFKYECKIGDVCIKKELTEVPLKGFKFDSDAGVLKPEFTSNKEERKIEFKVGTYIVGDREVTYDKDGNFKQGETIPNSDDADEGSICKDGGVVAFKVGGTKTIKSSKRVSKFVFKPESVNASKRSESDEAYGLMELTHLSCTVSKEIRNIFISGEDDDEEKDHIMITEEILDVDSAYSCNAKECKSITENEMTRYYINTAQQGKIKNAYAKCGYDDKKKKVVCVLLNIKEDDKLLFENAAATSAEDALISCNYKEGCKTMPVSGKLGLPLCEEKYDDIKLTYYVRVDNGEELEKDQYCIDEKEKIVSSSEFIESEIFVFDITYRQIDYSKIKENHKFASMYYKNENNGKYVQTYGYITSTDGYSKLTNEGLTFIKYKDTYKSCELEGTGSIIKEGSDVEICIGSEPPRKITGMDNTYNLLNINLNNVYPEVNAGNKILVKVKGDIVYSIYEDGYVLIDSDNKLVEMTVQTRKREVEPTPSLTLYQFNVNNMYCDSIENPSNGIYKTNMNEKTINCIGKKCNLKDIENLQFSKNITYSYIKDKNNLFSSVSTDEFIIEISEYKITPLIADNYILMDEKLYLCNSNKETCNEEDIKPGWYISGSESYKAIKCESGACKTVENLSSSCSKMGDLIYSTSAKTYQLCNTTRNGKSLVDAAGSIINLRNDNSNYDKIKSEFPEQNNIITISKNAAIGIGIDSGRNEATESIYKPIKTCYSIKSNVDETKQCQFSSSDLIAVGNYCIKNDQLYVTTEEKKCQKVDKNTALLLNGEIEIKSVADITLTTRMYYCNGEKCEITAGYMKLGNDEVKCDLTGCVKNESITHDFTDPITYSYSEDPSDFPGAANVKSALIETGSNYKVLFKGDGYYLINSSKEMLDKDSEENPNLSANATGNLYLCNKNDLSCVMQNDDDAQDKINGYFLNGKTKDNTSIIICKDGVCSIINNSNADNINDIHYGTDKCNSTISGSLVRDNKKNVKLCISNIAQSFTTNDSVKYYAIKLLKNNAFGSVRVTEENDVANIIVKVTSKSITQYKDKGYILHKSTNEIVENVGGNNSASLYNCKEDDDNRVVCDAVKNINNGWYFNEHYNDKRYIVCNSGACDVKEAPELMQCQSSGSLIYNDGKFKLCKTQNEQVDLVGNYKVIVNISGKEKFPSIEMNNTEILLEINNKNSVTIEKFEGYKIINEQDKKLIIDDDKEGLLYKCESTGECNRVLLPNQNYYLKNNATGFAEELIYCTGEYGSKCEIKNPEEGFYVGSDVNKPIIQCIQPGYEVDGSTTTTGNIVCKERQFKEGWFMNAGSDKNEYPLIYCNYERGCVTIKDLNDGWYINTGRESIFGYDGLNNSTIPSIIKCEGNSCDYVKSKDLKSACEENGGEIIISKGSIKLCKNNKESIDVSKASNTNIIMISENEKFPGQSGSDIIAVEINKFSAVQKKYAEETFLYINKEMYRCDDTCEIIKGNDETNGMKVLDQFTRNIYTSSLCDENSCSWVINKDEGLIFLDGNYKLVEGIGEGFNDISHLFKCKKFEKNPTCYELDFNEGYYINQYHKIDENKSGQKLYIYDGEWKIFDDEYKEKPTCTYLNYKQNYCTISYSDEVYSDSDNENIISAGEICKSSNGKYFIAYGEINTGIDSPNCVSFPNDATESYYKINENKYIMDKYGFFVVGDYVEKTNSKLVCNGMKCQIEKILRCSFNIQNGTCKSSSDIIKTGNICISEGNTYLALSDISTSEGSCIKYVSPSNEKTIPYSEYGYDNSKIVKGDNKNKYLLINNKLSIFNSQESVMLKSEGNYVIDNYNNLVNIGNNEISISENSIFKYILCDGNKCERRTTCLNKNEAEYIYDSNESIIKCDPLKKTIQKISQPGYYLNKPWNNLIKCHQNIVKSKIECKVINGNNGNEGYYINAGNKDKIIKCIRNEGRFSCSEENIVECTLDEKTNTCTSKLELLRNSYCIYRAEDKKLGKIEKLMYVENYIKEGEKGSCISGNDVDPYFYYSKQSKFLGHPERKDLIRVSGSSVTSIYENDIGYYVIDTKDGLGLKNDVGLEKSRFYECTKDGCIENVNPDVNKIYINKASSEKLIKYKGYWDVIIESKCTIYANNPKLCYLGGEGINNKGILYIENDGMLTFYVPTEISEKVNAINRNKFDTKDKELEKNRYIHYENNLYLLNSNSQSFDKQVKEGYYFFSSKKTKSFNLLPYVTTVNKTLEDENSNEISYYEVTKNCYGEINSSESKSINDLKKGCYWNRANENVVIQNMEISDKVKPEEEDEEGDKRRKRNNDVELNSVVKSNTNICKSVVKNNCVSAIEGQVISKGDVCLVKDGEFKGLYLIINDIKKGSSGTNCLRYDYGNVYHYVNEKTNINGKDYEKILVKIGKDEIVPFDTKLEDNSNVGYYVLNSNKQMISNESLESATAYNCNYKYDEENVNIEGFECNSFEEKGNKYYYGNYENILYASNRKWKVEKDEKYYFRNDENLASSYDEESQNEDTCKPIKLGNIEYNIEGYYLNSAELNRTVLVENKSEDYSIYKGLIKCKVLENGQCSSEEEGKQLVTGDICYDGSKKKLYVVEIEKSQDENTNDITKCYTGSRNLKYKIIDNVLYQLDGLSLKKMASGIYILNDKLEKFESEYPEKPYQIVSCENGGCEIKDKLQLESNEIVLNSAVVYEGSKESILKYYNETIGEGNEKFMNLKDNNKCYCLDKNGEIPNEDSDSCYYFVNCKTDSYNINYAINSNERMILKYESGYYKLNTGEYDNKKIKYDPKLDVIKHGNDYNIDENEIKYKIDNNNIFKLKPKYITYGYGIIDGLYLLKDGKPFESEEWTTLTEKEVCYAVKGSCNKSKLKTYRENKYVINKAVGKTSIVTYDLENNLWRTVKEDGYYFLFDHNGETYSINIEDRRPSKIYEIRNGELIEENLVNKEGEIGFYLFNDLIVEKVGMGWEDAKKILNNVDVVEKSNCNAIEKAEIIEADEYCYNENYGMCIVKSLIDDKTGKNSNCVFNTNASKHFEVINNELYLIDANSFRKITSSGIYVIGNDKLGYNGKKEGSASAYKCVDGKCTIANDLESQYYYNKASELLGEEVILYHDNARDSWRKTSESGKYVFNNKGYPTVSSEEGMKVYEVGKKGSKIEKVESASDGKLIVKTISNELFVIDVKNGKIELKRMKKCSVDVNGNVKVKGKLQVGDLCNADGNVVIITANKNAKREEVEDDEEVEYSYTGAVSDNQESKMIYIEEEMKFAELSNEGYEYLDIEGYVVLDKSNGGLLESTTEVLCDAYLCKDGKCTLLAADKIKSGNYYINSLSENGKLVKYVSNGKWKVESEIGYYFLTSDMKMVEKEGVPEYVIDVRKVNGKMEQVEITDENVVGFYLNKAGKNKYLVSNNEVFWSKGTELRICEIEEKEEGSICKTTKENEEYEEGLYCASKGSNVLYLLTGKATSTQNTVNCISRKDEDKYISSKKITKMNGIELKNKLIEFNKNAITLVRDGYYIISQNDTLISSDIANNEDVEFIIYNCKDTVCSTNVSPGEKLITNEGEIIEIDEEGKLVSLTENGLSFFSKEGKVCDESESEVGIIINVSENGKVNESIGLSDLQEGVYINESNEDVVAVKENGEWMIKSVKCSYDESKGTCSNEKVEFAVGDYCSYEKKLYVITETVEDEESKCVVGGKESPIIMKSSNGKLISVEEKMIQFIEDDGYYALSTDDTPFENVEMAESKLIKCEDDECNEVDVEVGSYLNKAPIVSNIVQYPSGKLEESVKSDKKCEINEEGIVSGEDVNVGDVCIVSQSLYLVGDDMRGNEVKKEIISYKLVENSLYKLNDDAVVQIFDGYYFVTGEDLPVTNVKDYAKVDTVGVMCSSKGYCFVMEPSILGYYPDYTTKNGKNFRIIKYNPSDKSGKREEESSGYEVLSEEGIYKMDDGSYAQCEKDNNDEVVCHDIEEKGAYVTVDDEVIVCVEDEDEEVQCSQATNGGYYWIDKKLYECDPSEDGDKLDCKEVAKEGYFISQPEGDLYECEKVEEETEIVEEETADVSKIYDGLNAGGEESSEEEDETTTTTSTEESTTTTTTTEESTTTTTTTT
ncbi:scaffoldin, partial [Piromyces finnis]